MDFQKRAALPNTTVRPPRRAKMLEAIPADADFNYKTPPQIHGSGQVSRHITDMTGDWALHTLTLDKLEFPADHKWEQYVPASKAALLEKFDRELVGVARGAGCDHACQVGRALAIYLRRAEMESTSRRGQVFRDMVMNHLVHHRAQLGVYLRLLDKGRSPETYGPSADEM